MEKRSKDIEQLEDRVRHHTIVKGPAHRWVRLGSKQIKPCQDRGEFSVESPHLNVELVVIPHKTVVFQVQAAVLPFSEYSFTILNLCPGVIGFNFLTDIIFYFKR